MKFREFKTSKGTEVFLGKDQEQNEALVKKFIGKGNVILHTKERGSPFCVITEKPKTGDKEEAAIICARYSQDWRDNKKNVIVHLFTGKDIYKEKTMPVGTFGVKRFRTIIVKKEKILRFL